MLLEALAVALAGHLAGAIEKSRQVAELVDELDRSLLADPRHPGHVVDRVALERHHVDHLGRRHAQVFFDQGRVVQLLAAGVEERHVLVHELHQILVGRDQNHLEALGRGLLGERAQNVVGLIVLELEDGNPQRLERAPDVGQLRDQILGHGRPVGLVVLELLAPDGGLGHVPGHAQVLRLFLAQELPEHVEEAVDRVGGQALRVGQAPDRIEGPEDVRIAVDQIDALRSPTLSRILLSRTFSGRTRGRVLGRSGHGAPL